MPLRDNRELIFEWSPRKLFGPPTDVQNDDEVDVDDIDDQHNIIDGDELNNDIVAHNLEGDIDDDTSSHNSDNVMVIQNDTDMQDINDENEDNTEDDAPTHDFDAYTPLHDAFKDDIPPPPRQNPSSAAVGVGISKVQPSFGPKAYGTSRFTTEDYENYKQTSIDNDDINVVNNSNNEENSPNTNLLSTKDIVIEKWRNCSNYVRKTIN